MMIRPFGGRQSTDLSVRTSAPDSAGAANVTPLATIILSRSPCTTRQTPCHIQPPLSAATHSNCKGALRVKSVDNAEGRMPVAFQLTQPSLLSPSQYRCTKERGAEPLYVLIEPDGVVVPRRTNDTN